jgi:hypothetical protein
MGRHASTGKEAPTERQHMTLQEIDEARTALARREQEVTARKARVAVMEKQAEQALAQAEARLQNVLTIATRR